MKKKLLAMLLVLGLVVSGLPGTPAFAEEEAGTERQEAVQEEAVKVLAPEKKAEAEAEARRKAEAEAEAIKKKAELEAKMPMPVSTCVQLTKFCSIESTFK